MTAPYPWQDNVWQTFLQLKHQNKLPHAILLSGLPNIGKLSFAKASAQALLGVDQKNQALCDSPDGHPDQLVIRPENEKLPIIKIEQIRQLKNFLSQTAQQGGYRIVIIDQTECMNLAAANALLKTLEEPGEQVLIFLLSSQPNQLLPTIRSRCQHWKIEAHYQQAHPFLKAHCQEFLPEQAWQLISGQPLLLLSPNALETLKQKHHFLTQCQQKISPLQIAAEFKEIALTQIVQWMIESTAHRLRQESIAQLTQQRLFAFLDKLYLANAQLQKSISVNAPLFLEDLLIEQQGL